MKVPSISELKRIQSEISSIFENLKTLQKKKDELEAHIAKSYVHVNNLHRVFSKLDNFEVRDGRILFVLRYKGYRFPCIYVFGSSSVRLRHYYRMYDLRLDDSFSCDVLELDEEHLKIEDCYFFESRIVDFLNNNVKQFVEDLIAKRLENRKVETINTIDVYDYNRDVELFPWTFDFVDSEPNSETLEVLEKYNIEHEISACSWSVTFNDIEEMTKYIEEAECYNLDLSFTKFMTSSDSLGHHWYLDLVKVNREEVLQPYSQHINPDLINLRNPIILEEYLKMTYGLFGDITIGDFNEQTFELIFSVDDDYLDYDERILSATVFQIDKVLSDANIGLMLSEEFMETVYRHEREKFDRITFTLDTNVISKECLNIIRKNFLEK